MARSTRTNGKPAPPPVSARGRDARPVAFCPDGRVVATDEVVESDAQLKFRPGATVVEDETSVDVGESAAEDVGGGEVVDGAGDCVCGSAAAGAGAGAGDSAAGVGPAAAGAGPDDGPLVSPQTDCPTIISPTAMGPSRNMWAALTVREPSGFLICSLMRIRK